MADPLAQIVDLLRPSVSHTKIVEGAGSWLIRRRQVDRPFCCAALEGRFLLSIAGEESITLEVGDFALVPMAREFAVCSTGRNPGDRHESVPVATGPDMFRVGDPAATPNVRMVVGYGRFGSEDAELLTSALPVCVHIRANDRLTTLLSLLVEESRARRTVRDVVLTRLLEVLLIEALREVGNPSASPGLLRGLADERLAVALRLMHERPSEDWTVTRLAREAALSRSVFFERFREAVGSTPIDYLTHWRMLLAKDLLRRNSATVAETAQRVGYGSASTFSAAFSRHVGVPPSLFARQEAREPEDPSPTSSP